MKLERIRHWLPEGSSLPDDVWARRHQMILTLVWLHVPAILLFGLARGATVGHSLFEAMSVAVFALTAVSLRGHRRLSTVVTSLGLLTCSAVLVHLSGGVIELHFHYFVMVALVTLYQDWRPLLFAIGYVVLQHGLLGALAPESVYNHAGAIEHPWRWAGVHGLFILGMSWVGIISWRFNEVLLRAAAARSDELAGAQLELTETLSLLSATLDSTADGILATDPDGRILSCNRRFVEMFRLPEAILSSHDGNQVLAFVVRHTREPAVHLAKVRQLQMQPEAERHDTIELLDGQHFEGYSQPQRVGTAIVGRVWTFHDVTERERLQVDAEPADRGRGRRDRHPGRGPHPARVRAGPGVPLRPAGSPRAAGRNTPPGLPAAAVVPRHDMSLT